MDIIKTKQLLEVLKGVNINQVGIYGSADDEKNQISGISEDKATLVFTEIDSLIDTNVGVVSVKSLLSRLNLFNEEKMGVALKKKTGTGGSEHVTEINIKEGRRKSKVLTTDPSMMAIPKKYPSATPVVATQLSKEYVDYLNKMKTSISTSSGDEMYVEISFVSDDENQQATISINGEYDDFEDKIDCVIEDDYIGENFSVQWKIDSFMNAIKNASSYGDEVVMQVSSLGILEVSVNDVTVSIVPNNVTSSKDEKNDEEDDIPF